MPCDPKKVKHTDFERFELRVGAIKAAKQHPEVDDYILIIDLGPVERDIQIVVNLKESYKLEELVGKQVIVIANICPETVQGVESQAMILVATKDNKPVLISPEEQTYPGVKVYGEMDSICGYMEELGK